MKDQSTVELGATTRQIPSQQRQPVTLVPGRPRRLYRFVIQWSIKDWHTDKYFFFAVLLLALTVITTVIYYRDYPRPELNADTPAYLYVVERIQTHAYCLVDIWRLPGYPLFIVLVYAFAGNGNLVAVSIMQGVLFVLATMEIYVLAILVLKRTWMAFLIGLIVGTNLILLSYVKPIMSEGLALWQLTTLALAVVYFIRTLRLHAFWLVVLCMVPLMFTRPEWLYLPVPLFAYLLLVAVRRGSFRSVLLNALIALACIYGLVGSYIGVNTLVNYYPGLTAIENFNLMGKVLQYNMQDEAPPEYAQVSHQLDILVVRVDRDPYHVLPYIPSLSKNDDLPAGILARNIILHHPVEFLLKSIPLFPPSLIQYYDSSRAEYPRAI